MASPILIFRSFSVSSSDFLVVTRPRTATRSSGRCASGSKPPGRHRCPHAVMYRPITEGCPPRVRAPPVTAFTAPVIVDSNPRKAEGCQNRKHEPVSLSGHRGGELALASRRAAVVPACTGHCRISSTGCRPGGRINAEDPAYAEDPGPWGVPDPPRKPFPPRYFPERRISGRLAHALPAGNTPEAAIHQRGSHPAENGG